MQVQQWPTIDAKTRDCEWHNVEMACKGELHMTKVDFLGKYVRPEKVDGCYLAEKNGGQVVYNWKP